MSLHEVPSSRDDSLTNEEYSGEDLQSIPSEHCKERLSWSTDEAQGEGERSRGARAGRAQEHRDQTLSLRRSMEEGFHGSSSSSSLNTAVKRERTLSDPMVKKRRTGLLPDGDDREEEETLAPVAQQSPARKEVVRLPSIQYLLNFAIPLSHSDQLDQSAFPDVPETGSADFAAPQLPYMQDVLWELMCDSNKNKNNAATPKA
jgi:hypothetical protein